MFLTISIDGKWFGVDVFHEDVADNYLATVWEPALVKINALTAAAEAAALIISVDETVKNPTSSIVCVHACVFTSAFLYLHYYECYFVLFSVHLTCILSIAMVSPP